MKCTVQWIKEMTCGLQPAHTDLSMLFYGVQLAATPVAAAAAVVVAHATLHLCTSGSCSACAAAPLMLRLTSSCTCCSIADAYCCLFSCCLQQLLQPNGHAIAGRVWQRWWTEADSMDCCKVLLLLLLLLLPLLLLMCGC
jgi:hypothetical protein